MAAHAAVAVRVSILFLIAEALAPEPAVVAAALNALQRLLAVPDATIRCHEAIREVLAVLNLMGRVAHDAPV